MTMTLDELESEMRKWRATRGDYATSVDVLIAEWHIALSRHIAAQAPVPPIGVRFGIGGIIVNTGTYDGEPAVILDVAPSPGVVGAKAPNVSPDILAPVHLLFPTHEQAKRVADALVNAPAAPLPKSQAKRQAIQRGESGAEARQLCTTGNVSPQAVGELLTVFARDDAEIAGENGGPMGDDETIYGGETTYGHFRRARAEWDAARANAPSVQTPPEVAALWRADEAGEITTAGKTALAWARRYASSGSQSKIAQQIEEEG